MGAVFWHLVTGLGGALGWAWLTANDDQPETVAERLKTNLGTAAMVAGAAVAAVYLWRRGR